MSDPNMCLLTIARQLMHPRDERSAKQVYRFNLEAVSPEWSLRI